MTENDDKSICRSKFCANGMQYFKLFEKHIPTRIEGNVLLVSIGNPDCISYIINLNPNAIYYVYDSVYVNNILSYNNAFNITFNNLDNDNLEQLIDSIDMKFDCIIMNPPYQKNLHLKILAEAIKHLKDDGVCINLSPVRWLQDPLAKYKKNSDYNKFRQSISEKITSLSVISTGNASKIFNTPIRMDLAIYSCSNKGGYDYVKFNTNKLLNKILAKNTGIKTEPYQNSTSIFVPVILINGGHNERHQTDVDKMSYDFCRNSKYYGKYFVNGISTNGKTLDECKQSNPHCTNGNVLNWPIVKFNSEQEASNFVDSTNTDFFKFVYKTEVRDVHVSPEYLPWMGDAVNPRTGLKGYLSEWTDEDFYRYFELTDDEVKVVEDTMKKYEAK